MYRINRLSRPVLITVDEVVAKAVVDENTDIRYLMNSIEVAEERFISTALGNAFYEDFIAQKNVVVTIANQATLLIQINASLEAVGKNPILSAQLIPGMMVNAIEFCEIDYQTLWNRYLWKLTAEAVDNLAIVPSWTRSTAQGQQQNNPKSLTGNSDGGSGTAGLKDVQYKVDHMLQSRIFPLIAEMKKWICNTGGYTLFDGCNKAQDGISKRQGGIILDLYDDSNPNGPDMWQQPNNDHIARNKGCGSSGGGGIAPAPTPTPAPQTMWRSIKIFVKDVPDPLILIPVGGGKTIQAQYAAGATVTPMKIGDAAGYLANRPYFLPITLNGQELPDGQYNSTLGQFSGGFNDGDYITLTFLDNV